MKLNELLGSIDVGSRWGDARVDITGVTYDSRRVQPGYLFVAVHGSRTDGNRFAEDAIRRGAAAIVSEASAPAFAEVAENSVPWLQVDSDREALAKLASVYYGRPTDELTLVGITGTNGKTTTAHLVESILRAAGLPVTLLGTAGHRGPGLDEVARLTTPESSDLEAIFRKAVDQGCRHAVMEVSSHAIAMKRVEQLAFEVVAFTNLSAEHLDFHSGMEEYFSVKQKLFTGLAGTPPPVAVLNRDDQRFNALRAAGNRKCICFGMTADADIYPTRVNSGRREVRADFETPRGRISVNSGLMGRLNLYNLAAAIGIGFALDLETEPIVEGIGALTRVAGRFEFVDRGQDFSVIVDYAHTPDALERVLKSAREITPGKLYVVFGAGGDRDPWKRREMGKVAAAQCDFSVLTSDNPRSEEPLEIIRMIEEGFPRGECRHAVVPDRREAIRTVLERARKGDMVVIAGKGHETHQVVGSVELPFDDRAVVGELLDELIAR